MPMPKAIVATTTCGPRTNVKVYAKPQSLRPEHSWLQNYFLDSGIYAVRVLGYAFPSRKLTSYRNAGPILIEIHKHIRCSRVSPILPSYGGKACCGRNLEPSGRIVRLQGAAPREACTHLQHAGAPVVLHLDALGGRHARVVVLRLKPSVNLQAH